MKKYAVYTFLLGCFFLKLDGHIFQNKQTNMYDSNVIGIKISKVNFNSKVKEYLEIMKLGKDLNTQDFIDLVRIYNTLDTKTRMNEKQSYKDFIHLFTEKYQEIAAKKLKAKLTKGMCYYSKNYDLYIGGKPHTNSMYFIN